MGGLGPGIGGLEYLIIAAVALIVVGPERLPVMLRQLGKWVGQMRRMANEFRASFDDMARQSELDELRKEVEALRTGQTVAGQGLVRLGAEADAAFKDIKSELDKPAIAHTPSVALGAPEFPEPAMTPLSVADAGSSTDAAATSATPKARKPRAAKSETSTAPAKPPARPKAKLGTAASRPRSPRKPKAAS